MYKLIYITTANEREAKKIAEVLVRERLAACANIFPIESIYKWTSTHRRRAPGKIEREDEVALIVKTKAKLVDKIIERVKELHSYEVPCIISIPIEKGYQKFLDWINQSTK
jgi:periplasmic divalent cation tolerance protein